MSEEEKSGGERHGGWLGQLKRVRHRGEHGSRRAAGVEKDASAAHAPEEVPPPLELASLCNYGERNDPEFQVDDDALESLCFQCDKSDGATDGETAVDPEMSQRQSRRVRVPAHFYHVGNSEHFMPIDASIILPPQFPHRVVNCFLYDVNDGGTAFVSMVEVAAGTPVTLCLAHPENATPLIAAETVVLHSRPLHYGSTIPADYAGGPLWLHGVALNERDALVIYKATLDSMALKAAAGNARHDN